MNENIHQWADFFLKLPTSEMSVRLTEDFVTIRIGMPETATAEEVYQRAGVGDFGLQVMKGRAKLIGLKMTGQAVALIRVLSESPGTIVMWLHALRSWQVRNGDREITLDVLSIQLFPWGFPTAAGLQSAWDRQKLDDGSNMLDRCTAETFIIEEKTNATDGKDA